MKSEQLNYNMNMFIQHEIECVYMIFAYILYLANLTSTHVDIDSPLRNPI